MYADFDHRYRPRPLRWRIALVSFCHFILGVTITNALVSIGDVVKHHVAEVTMEATAMREYITHS